MLDLSLPTAECSPGRTGHYRAEQKPHHSECCGRWGSSNLSLWPCLAAAGWGELRARRSSHLQAHSAEVWAWAKLVQPGSAGMHITSKGCDITVHLLVMSFSTTQWCHSQMDVWPLNISSEGCKVTIRLLVMPSSHPLMLQWGISPCIFSCLYT